MMLHVAHGLTLPLELAGRTQVILAQKGAGKTYTAMRETEQLLAAGQQVVALDPTGVWWGLRSPAAGGGKGFRVIVMGGDHADLPLEPTAGTIVAEFVAESRESVILDLSGFESNAAQNRFVTDFAERLYRAKASERRTIHLMLDEADSFCPQRPQPGEQRMLGAFEAIVRRGRSRGIGITLISQRPAVLNKNVMSQADLLVCLRVVGQHDHKALREWTNLYATAEQQKEFMESLPTLKTGEAWFWSPSWLNIFQRAQVTKRISYDSSATPDESARESAPAPTVKVDLEKLSAAIRETAERAEANDPRKLRARNAELERRLSNMVQREVELTKKIGAGMPAKEAPTKEVPVLKDGQLDRAEKLLRQFAGFRTSTIKREDELIDKLKLIFSGLSDAITSVRNANMQKDLHTAPVPISRPQRAVPTRPEPRQRSHGDYAGDNQASAGGELKISATQQRILDALAWFESIGNAQPTTLQVGAIALIDATGGHFSNTVGPLSTNGLVVRGNGSLSLTDEGRRIAQVPEKVANLAQYHDVLRDRVRRSRSATGKTVAILDVVISRGGESVSIEEIGQEVQIDHTGGHFSNTIGPLSTLGFIRRTRGIVEPTEIIFPPGLT